MKIKIKLHITSRNSKLWMLNDDYHRINKPACVWNDGESEWYEFGNLIRSEWKE